LLKSAYFLLGAFLIYQLAMLFGHRIIDATSGVWPKEIHFGENPLIGNDSLFALSLVSWFDRFFPRVPLWYPLQGMGVSLFHSYPMGTTFLVIILRRLLDLTQAQAFRLVSFSAFVIAPVGIYFLAWNRVKNQTAGFLAGIFFLLSQASWLFQTKHGIFAQSFSICVVPWVFLFYFLFWDATFNNESLLKKRFWLFCASFSLGILFLVHVVAGMVTLLSLFCFSFFSCLIRKWQGKKLRLIEGLLVFLVFSLLGVGIASFWLIPFRHYNSLANREGLLTESLEQLQAISLKPKTLLGLSPLGEEEYRYDFFFFAGPVLILAGIGFLLAILQKKKALSLGMTLLVLAFFTSAAIYFPLLASFISYIYSAVYFRALIPVIVLLPVMAAFGAIALPELIIQIPAKIGSFIWKPKEGLVLTTLRGLGVIGVSLLGLGLSAFLIIKINHAPPVTPEFAEREGKSYGLHRFKPYGPSLAQDVEVLEKGLEYAKSVWPKFVLSPKSGGMEGFAEKLVKDYQLSENTRIDISPYALGGYVLQSANTYTDVPFVSLYHYSASIIHAMWGYQQGVFYGDEEIYKNPILIEELTKYFGIKYAIIEPEFDAVERYQAAGWKPVGRIGKAPNYPENVWQSPEETDTLSLSDKPIILVIGDFKKATYETVFRIANLGIIPYEKAILVEGTKKINDYSLKELRKFSGVILHGYSYRGNAWKTIGSYVAEGGRVFVDTGLQYTTKDWGKASTNGFVPIELAEPFPVKKTLWQSLGREWDEAEIKEPSLKRIDPKDFAPLDWRGDPWWLAAAAEEDLKEGSRAILTKENKVLLAERDYGQGKIIWSGMNLPTHLWEHQAEAEIEFTRLLLLRFFLKDEGFINHNELISFKRDWPDQVEFDLQKTDQPLWLLWRESFSPDWKAVLAENAGGKQKEKLKIYRAGPGFQLIYLPELENGGKLTLSYSLGLRGLAAKIISLLSFLFLFYLLFEGIKGKSLIEEKILGKITIKRKDIRKKIQKQWSDEEY
jgi:hypothetical protein